MDAPAVSLLLRLLFFSLPFFSVMLTAGSLNSFNTQKSLQ